MGTVNDQWTLVQGSEKEHVEHLRKLAIDTVHKLFAERDLDKDELEICVNLVGEVRRTVRNGNFSFVIHPDGSKEGWDIHEAMNDVRGLVLEEMRKMRRQRPAKWVEAFNVDLTERGDVWIESPESHPVSRLGRMHS